MLPRELVHVSLLVYACLHDVLQLLLSITYRMTSPQLHSLHDISNLVAQILGRTGTCAHVSNCSNISGSV